MNPARLLFPVVRFDEGRTVGELLATACEQADLGVGGFIVFGGEAAEVRRLIATVRSHAGRPLLFGADLERGGGQQFAGATLLPPAGALGRLDDPDVLREAGALTGREARALGIDWVFAPVADLDIEARNPIVGTRSFGEDPADVARRIVPWIGGCRAEGVLCCAKHFPGHGRTTSDSHVETPEVTASPRELEADLAPFRAAVEAGVDSVMTAHVHYPALDPEPGPATRSRAIVTDLLRGQLGFDGLVVSDALIMAGAEGGAEATLAATAAAGVDALLYPPDPAAAATELAEALRAGSLDGARAREAVRRLEAAAVSVPAAGRGNGEVGSVVARAWAASVAERTLFWRCDFSSPEIDEVELVVIDDDLGGPYPPPSRDPFVDGLRDAGIRPAGESAPGILVALFNEPRGWKGRAGLSASAAERLGEVVSRAHAADRSVTVALFGAPRLAAELLADVATLVCWGGEPIMQRAAAATLGRWFSGLGGER